MIPSPPQGGGDGQMANCMSSMVMGTEGQRRLVPYDRKGWVHMNWLREVAG